MAKKQTNDPINEAFNAVADDVQEKADAQAEKQAELNAKNLEDLENDKTLKGKMKLLAEGLCLQIQQRFNLAHPVSPLVIPELDTEGASGCYAVYSETAQTDVMVMWAGPRYADKILGGDVDTIKTFIEAAVRTLEDYPELISQQPAQPSPGELDAAPEPPGEETPAPVAPITPEPDPAAEVPDA